MLIVVRGYHYREDLATLRPYIREYRPVLIGVDGGADALLEAGYSPHMIVGDMDSVSDEALTLRRRAGRARLPRRPGARPGAGARARPSTRSSFPAAGTSEDVAMLLADDKGADLIVAVGTHATLVEFLDKGRAGMASTFLTRLRVGGKLVDAKGVSRLYRSRISTSSLLLLVPADARRHDRRHRRPRPPGDAFAPVVADKWHQFVYLADRTLHVIDFRYHLVSIIAVFLALALGLVLGASALQGSRPASCAARPRRSERTTRTCACKSAPSTSRTPTTARSWNVSPQARGRPAQGPSVVFIEAPGADDQMRAKTADIVGKAGARISGYVTLQDKYLDGNQLATLSALTDQLERPAWSSRPTRRPTHRAATELAAVLVTKRRRAAARRTPPPGRCSPDSRRRVS